MVQARLAAFRALKLEPQNLLRFADDSAKELRRAPPARLRLVTDPGLQVRLAVYQDRRVQPELLPSLGKER